MKITTIGILFLLVAFAAPTTPAQKKASGTKKASTTTKPTATAKTGTVEMEAGLVFNNGDVKPVGRATFYLLKENAETVVLTEEHKNIYRQEVSRFGSISDPLSSMYSAVLYMDGRITPNYAITVKKSLETAAVVQTTTGFDGKATFPAVPAGDYYLFGYYKIGKQTTYWNVPVSVKPGVNKVILDNENMK